MNEKKIGMGLCYRCEHRATFLETGDCPRFECGMEKSASRSCYMFLPCMPVAVTPIPGENRPIFDPWIIAGRVHALGLVDNTQLRLKLIDIGGGAVSAQWIIKSKGKNDAKVKKSDG